MKKFFIALSILFCVAGNNFAEAIDKFTDEQLRQMVSFTLQNPASKSLDLDVATFRNNFDAFMSDFIKQVNAGEHTAELEQLFLIGEPNLFNEDANTLFVKKFVDGIAIFGSVDENGKLKVLNFFATKTEDQKEMLICTLVLNAFVCGISPDGDMTALLNAAKENPTVTKDGVKYSFSTVGNLNIVSAVAE